MTLRSIAKPVAEEMLLASGVPALWRMRRRDQVLVLAYHNVVHDDASDCGDRSLHLRRSRFAAQLDLLARTHSVVPLSEALEANSRSQARPRAAITFDDAYRGALTIGVAELARRRMSATVFVAPGFVGGASFWWDVIAVTGGPSAEATFRERALNDCGGRDEAVRELGRRSGFAERVPPADARCATESELSAAVAAGIGVGSHSWSHPNLAALSANDLADELTRPLEWLRQRFESVLPVLAYPYGRFSDGVVAAARRAGYGAGLRIGGGWMRAGGVDAMRVPRLDVSAGLSGAGFALRAAGMFAA